MSESIYTYLNRNLYRNTSVNNLSTSDAESVSQLSNSTMVTTDQVYADTLLSGEIDGTISFTGGFIQSKNFVSGVSGWRLSADGTLEAVDAILSGAISATSGTIGAFEIGTDYIRDVANSFGLASTVTGGDDVRFWAGDTYANRATADFRITESGAVTASSITITGGSIAGTPISSIPNNSSTDISLLEATHDLVFSVTDKDTVAWATGTITLSNGRTFSISSGNTGNMAARTYIYLDTGVSSTVLQATTTASTAMGANKKLIAVAQNGSAQAQFTVYGGIGGIKLPASGTSISNNNWTYSGTWSVTDADTVAWGSGTLTTSDGGSYSISGSNTGNMSAKTYIYFDLGTSSTAFQTTTTASTSIGDGKILIAIAQNGTGEANFIVVNDKQLNIDAANIVAGSITANEISAGAVTAGKIDVSQLSAITADLGAITAGTIVLPSGGFIRSGQTAYDTGTGFYIGNDSSVPKFSIGVSTGQKVTWDGSTLSIVGNQNVSTVFVAGEAVSAGNALYIATAGSDTTISQTTDSSTTASSDTNDWLGQTFPAGSNPNELTNAKFKLSITGSPTGNLYVGLYATSAGLPTSQLFTSANVDVTTLTGTPTLTTFTFTNTPLEPGATYAVILKTDNITYNGGTIVFQTDGTSNSYAGGWHVATTDGSTWFAPNSGNTDLVFEVNIEGTTVGRVYKTDATTSTETTTWIGFAYASAAKAANVAVVTDGILTGLSGLTIGSQYYLSDTQGAIATSAGTNSRKVGMAITTTALIIRQDNP